MPPPVDRSPRRGVDSPDDFEAVVPSDTVDLNFNASCFWIGVTGDVALMNKAGVGVVWKAVPAGYFAARSSRVMATGTTATNIVACKHA